MGASVFRVVGGSLLTLAVVWGLVLGWWQSIDHQPSTAELGLYLGAIPLVLIGGYFLLHGFIAHLKSPSPAATPAPALPADADPLATADARGLGAERGLTACLLDTALLTPAGSSGEAVLAAVEAGLRPGPSAHLRDAEGFPVFAAEVADLDPDAMADHLASHLADNAAVAEAAAHHPDLLRALALLDDVLQRIGERIAARLDHAVSPAFVQVLWLTDARWPADILPPLRAWLLATHFSRLEPDRFTFSSVPTHSEAEALGQVDEVVRQLGREEAVSRLVVVACAASAVDPRSISHRERAGLLFGADRQQHAIPGEGAVALLFGSAALIRQQPADAAPPAVISRVARDVRDKAVDAGGQVSGRLVARLAADLLDVHAIPVETIGTVLLDTDHRARHIAEALDAVGSHLPHLDPIEDCPAIGTVLGSASPVGGLLALACAHARAVADGRPVLCVSNQHPTERAALLVWPQPPLAPIPPAPAGT